MPHPSRTSNGAPQADTAEVNSITADGVIDELRNLCSSTDEMHSVYERALHLFADHFQSPYALLQTQSVTRRFEEECCRGKVPSEVWRHLALGPLLACVTERRAHAPIFHEQRNDIRIAAVSVPLHDVDGQVSGAITILVQCDDARHASACLTELQSFTTAMRLFCERGAAGEQPNLGTQSGLLASLIVAEHGSLHQLAFAITNGFKTRFNCEEVCLGRIRGRKVKLLSISGMDQLYPSSPGTIQIRQAMEECLDASTIVCAQPKSVWDVDVCDTDYALHSNWRTKTGNSNCLSIPLVSRDSVVGVLSLRRDEGSLFNNDDLEALKETTKPLGTAISVKEMASRSVVRHLIDEAKSGLHWLCMAKSAKHRMFVAAVLALMTIVLFGKVTFFVSVPCRLASNKSRLFAAPFEGEISDSFVEAGDAVEEGQLLFAMDTRGLDLQRDKLAADSSQAELRMGEALKSRNRAQAAEAQAELGALQAELRIVEMQISQAVVRANRDGIVTEGHPADRIGEVVAMGETLLRVNPLGSLNAELLIPEDDIAFVLEEQGGELVTNARPDVRHQFTIRRIEPTAEVVQGKNVFVAKVNLEEVDDWQRIGMEGVAHIETGKQFIWWVLLRKPVGFVRKKAWL